MREPFADEERETVHVYVVRERANDPPIVDAEPEPELEPSQPPLNSWGITYCSLLGALFTLMPLVAILVATLLPPYDAMLSKTLTLTLSLRPTSDQIQLSQLPEIAETSQATVPATGSIQEPATHALGLITFYNGLFTPQVVQAGTPLAGKDGITVVTGERALIPAAIQTTPPTYGTVSVTASSATVGTSGNIAASDINQACCGLSILAQNLDAFSGGANAQEVAVLTTDDLANATARLHAEVDQEARDQAQSELHAGQQLLPLGCTVGTKASHHAGDQAMAVTVTVSAHCLPLVYALAAVQLQATAVFSRSLSLPYRLLRVSMILLDATAVDARTGTATLTVHLTAWVQIIRPSRRREHFTEQVSGQTLAHQIAGKRRKEQKNVGFVMVFWPDKQAYLLRDPKKRRTWTSGKQEKRKDVCQRHERG